MADALTQELLQSNRVYELNPKLRLKAIQAAWVCNLSESDLKERRRSKPPRPPLVCVKENPDEHPRYTLGECLAWLERFGTIEKPDESTSKKQVRKGPKTFTAFLDRGALTDRWPMTITQQGHPRDFFGALEDEDLDDGITCAWLTLGDYLEARLKAAKLEESQATARKVDKVLKKGKPWIRVGL